MAAPLTPHTQVSQDNWAPGLTEAENTIPCQTQGLPLKQIGEKQLANKTILHNRKLKKAQWQRAGNLSMWQTGINVQITHLHNFDNDHGRQSKKANLSFFVESSINNTQYTPNTAKKIILQMSLKFPSIFPKSGLIHCIDMHQAEN